MPCACQRCIRHSRTLGLPAKAAPSQGAIRKAYRASAKLWHPDRFENNPVKRVEAEEQFKRLQEAYRELWEHCETPVETKFDAPADAAPQRPPAWPTIFFGDAPGCFVAPRFPWYVEGVIASHLFETESPIAFVDFSAGGMRGTICSQYIFFTNHRIFVRDAMNVISLLWYYDLGEVLFADNHADTKSGIWRKIVRNFQSDQQRYSLQINRHNGTHFYSIEGQVNDNIKKVIYNFLLQMKPQQRP
jgi:DnaJ domain